MPHLTIEWLKFLPSLVLLLTPVRIFHGDSVHVRAISRGWDRHWAQVLTLTLHGLDLTRAALGSWLLIDSLSVPGAHGVAAQVPFLAQGAIRLAAVLLQTVPCKERDCVNAPFAFVIGLLLGGHSPLAAVFAIVLTVTLASGARTPAAFFPLLALSFPAASFLFGKVPLLQKSAFGAGAALLPWLWALLFSRELVVSYRARPSVQSRSPLTAAKSR
ncbi:MAG TPA: hypothetical protein VHD62_13915 [Opitutaceae bacterium]|nr:hypothetical protein [Opitutaceae bacterium]